MWKIHENERKNYMKNYLIVALMYRTNNMTKYVHRLHTIIE